MILPLASCVVQDKLSCNRGDGQCAAVDLDPPPRVKAGQPLSLGGSCLEDGSSVVVDFQSDGIPTPGISTDPLTCACVGRRITCPSVSIDLAALATDTLSYRTTLINRVGQRATDLDSGGSRVLFVGLTLPVSITDNSALVPTGICAPAGGVVTVTAPTGFSPSQVSCACAGGALAACGTFTESSAPINQTLAFGATVAFAGDVASTQGSTRVSNLPPVPKGLAVGLGFSYQSPQLGGLSFTRYGHGVPAANLISHDELGDFVDEPVLYQSGYREDGSVAQRSYVFAGTSAPGWAQSAQLDKYADGGGYITPVAGGDNFGDTYRGFFVPPQDGVYQFSNLVLPDNSVRVMMSPNECPHAAIAVFSGDIGGSTGAVHPSSKWISGNGGTYRTSFGGPFGANNEYLHNTAGFYPLGLADANYGNGRVYLLANEIYYLEIRYGEGGGGNAFQFGFSRTPIGGGATGPVAFLPAAAMLPYAGTDRYVTRQACLGQFEGASLFTDPENDQLVYSARLVGPNAEVLPAPQSHLSSVGLAINSTTGRVSGSLRNYVGQRIVVTARDPGGSNVTRDSFPVRIIP